MTPDQLTRGQKITWEIDSLQKHIDYIAPNGEPYKFYADHPDSMRNYVDKKAMLINELLPFDGDKFMESYISSVKYRITQLQKEFNEL